MSLEDDHPVLSAVGIAAAGMGVLMVVDPSFAALVGTGYAAVTMVGLLALVQGYRVVRSRRASDVIGAETPDVETVPTVPTPGEEFDELLASLRSGPRRKTIRQRSELQETLEELALTTVAHRENCSREAAAEYLRDGTWTGDPHAAAFFGGSDVSRPPLVDRLKLAASTESRFQHRARRTADAIARLSAESVGAEPNGRGRTRDGDDGRGGTANRTSDDATSRADSDRVAEVES